jgi:hypothetical protein
MKISLRNTWQVFMVHSQKLKSSEKIISQKLSCFIYGEAVRDRKFLQALINLDKFKYHTSKWIFHFDNGSGGSSEQLLEKCQKLIYGRSFHLSLCIIDLDHLKKLFPRDWGERKKDLDKKYPKITIIWQEDNLEDEFRKVLGNQHKGKSQINLIAKREIKRFINSMYWKRILKQIKSREKELLSQD